MKTSKNQPEIYQFFLKTADSLKFFFWEEITVTNQMVLWSEFSWKNRNRWLYDSEIFKEPIQACDLLEMQRTAEQSKLQTQIPHWKIYYTEGKERERYIVPN
jgi:hypothetical protein